MVSVGFVATQASTGLLVLLGLAVLLVRPRTRISVAFGSVAAAAGVGTFCVNQVLAAGAGMTTAAILALLAITFASFAVVFAGAFMVLFGFPTPLGPGERPFLALPALGAAAGAVAGGIASSLPGFRAILGLADEVIPAATVMAVVEFAAFGLLVGAAAAFGLRYRRTADPTTRAQFALMGAGWTVWLAASGGAYLISPVDGLRVFGTMVFGCCMMALGAWLWATSGPNAQGARNVALLICAASLAGLAVGVAAGDRSIDDTGLFGVVRLLSFSIFAYAILRHQLLGLDVKVRWTVSKGTVAGAIVAVFLVGSQLVQNLTSAQFGIWGGAVLAGLALFALGPLQSLADRFAHRLVPVVDASKTREATYSDAVRMALRAGMGRKEELTLAALARDLGLDPHRALELRYAAEGTTTRAGKK